MVSGDGWRNTKIFKYTRIAAAVLAGLFVLLSIMPYIVPLQTLNGDRNEMVYENSAFIEVEDLELHYRQWGANPGDREMVLLVHGLGASTFSWRYTAPALKEAGYFVVAVDFPGFGLSERSRGVDHSSAARAELLWSFLEKLYHGEKWHLVGHSMGGAAVGAMALQQPEQTMSVTLAAGAIRPFEPSVLSILIKYPPVNRWVRLVGTRTLINRSSVARMLESAYGRVSLPGDVEGYYLPLTVEETDITYVDLINSAPAPLLENIRDITVPVFLIWGEEDAWVPLEHGRELERLIPASVMTVLAGEGHCPMETAPALFNAALIEFIADANNPSGCSCCF